MEIRSVKNYQLPKFATLLAAAALAGTMTGCHQPSHPGEALVVDGVAPAPIETDVMLMGDEVVIDDPEPDTPGCIPIALEEFDGEFEQANLEGVSYETLFKDAFTEKGMTLISAVNTKGSHIVWTSEDGRQLQVCFFDPDIRKNGCTMHDAIAAHASREYQWGIVTEQSGSAEEPEAEQIIYVNIDWCAEGMTAERAAKIAEDVMA